MSAEDIPDIRAWHEENRYEPKVRRKVLTADNQWAWESIDTLLAEIDSLAERMSWISDHDRTGRDHLAQMMEHANRADHLEAIVRDLADSDPNLETGDMYHVCSLCDAQVPVRLEHHAESCPWRRSSEWVTEHPKESE